MTFFIRLSTSGDECCGARRAVLTDRLRPPWRWLAALSRQAIFFTRDRGKTLNTSTFNE